MIDDAIREVIAGLSAVTALLANSAAGDKPIRVDVLDETDVLPAVVVVVDEEEVENTLDVSGGPVVASVTIECYGTTKRQSKQLLAAVRKNGTTPSTGLQDYSGNTDDGRIAFCEVTGRSGPRFERDGDGSDSGAWVAELRLRVGYEESQ